MIGSTVTEATLLFKLSLGSVNTFAIHNPEMVYIKISPCRKLSVWDFRLLWFSSKWNYRMEWAGGSMGASLAENLTQNIYVVSSPWPLARGGRANLGKEKPREGRLRSAMQRRFWLLFVFCPVHVWGWSCPCSPPMRCFACSKHVFPAFIFPRICPSPFCISTCATWGALGDTRAITPVTVWDVWL